MNIFSKYEWKGVCKLREFWFVLLYTIELGVYKHAKLYQFFLKKEDKDIMRLFLKVAFSSVNDLGKPILISSTL